MNLFKTKKQEEQKNTATLEYAIEGMHCTSCAMNIDGALEDLPGVVSADTSYAKSTTKVVFDPEKVSPDAVLGAIKEAGYLASSTKND